MACAEGQAIVHHGLPVHGISILPLSDASLSILQVLRGQSIRTTEAYQRHLLELSKSWGDT